MLETVARLQQEGFDLAPFVAVREELDDAIYADAERATGVTPTHIVADRYALLQSASVSLVASGTATLEAALCGRPFCVVYKTGWITYQIARRVINLNNVGLVNIIAGETIVPEFLQSEMTASNLAGFCREIFSQDAVAETMINRLRSVRGRLGEPGASQRAADLIAREYLR
jgi:lipid-A-disaccharide synthase